MKILSLLTCLLFLSSAYATNESDSTSTWSQKMQKLYSALTTLLADLSSDEKFKDSKNDDKIQKDIQELGRLAHQLDKNEMKDPSMLIFSGTLAVNLDQASSALKGGHREYARSMIRQITNSCFQCHSRNDNGPQFGTLPFDADKIGLRPIELANFYAGTRQFDRSFDLYQKLIENKSDDVTPWDWQKAVSEALTIAVRIKNSPEQTQQVIDTVLKSPLAPKYAKEDAERWSKSVKEWKRELVSAGKKNDKPGEDQLFNQAKKLITQASREQKYLMDHGADVLYLRATALLHSQLDSYPNGKRAPDALLALGSSYEVLNPSPQEYLNKSFYTVCIKKAPHTEIARNCYRRLEQSTFFGFTGSSGMHLPDDVRNSLLELWSIAMPITQDPPQQKKP